MRNPPARTVTSHASRADRVAPREVPLHEATLILMGATELDRHAYRMLLREELGCSIVAECDFKATAVWMALRANPEAVLALVDVPSTEEIESIQMINRLHPRTRVGLVSATVDPALVERWAGCRLRAYVVKSGGVDELREGVAALLRGQTFFSAGIQQVLERADESRNGLQKLSRREAELLPLLARGLTLREAAEAMSVSYKTADSYRSSLLRKLGLHDRVQLARYAIRERIIDP